MPTLGRAGWVAAFLLLAGGASALPSADLPPCPAATRRKDETLRGLPLSWCEDAQGRRQGPFIARYPSGAVMTRGTYRDNREEGLWRSWDKQGRLVSEEEYRSGHVIGRRRLPGQSPPRAARPGDPVYPCPPGTVVAGAAPPQGVAQWCEKRRPDGAYVRHGPSLQWLSRKPRRPVLERGQYRDGLRDGTFTTYWADGTPKEEVHYAAGKRILPHVLWYESGQKELEEVVFDKGSRLRSTRWNEDGSLSDEEIDDAAGGILQRTFWYPNGKRRSEETWSGGKPNGLQSEWWPNGALRRQGEKRNGEEVGTWREWKPDGTLMQIQTNLPDRGEGRQTFFVWHKALPSWVLRPEPRGPSRGQAPPLGCRPPSIRVESQVAGDVIEGCVIGQGPIDWEFPGKSTTGAPTLIALRGTLDGPLRIWDAQGGRLMTAEYHRGKLNHRRIDWRKDGTIAHIDGFEDGVENGPFASWYPNGALQVAGSYDHGQLDGSWLYCRETGLCYEQRGYKKGRKDGLWIKWGDDGTKLLQKEYRAGRLDGPYLVWNVLGVKQVQGAYRAGAKDGPWIQWKGSAKVSEGAYRDGKRVGEWRFYHPNGRVLEQGRYERGRRVGIWTSYYQNGQKRAQGSYAWCASPPGTSVGIHANGTRDFHYRAHNDGCRIGDWKSWDELGDDRGIARYDDVAHQGSSSVRAPFRGRLVPPASP